MKNLIASLIYGSLLILSGPAFAQNTGIQSSLPTMKRTFNRHALTVEALGRGGLYSLNYDYLVSLKSAVGFGFSYQSLRANPAISDVAVQLITLPVYANFYFPFSEHRPFVSTAVTFLKAHATANIDLSNIITGMRWTYNNGDGAAPQTLSADKTDLSLNNNVDILVAVPSLGTGYEYRTAAGAIFRVQALGFITDKIIPWAGLSFGVGI